MLDIQNDLVSQLLVLFTKRATNKRSAEHMSQVGVDLANTGAPAVADGVRVAAGHDVGEAAHGRRVVLVQPARHAGDDAPLQEIVHRPARGGADDAGDVADVVDVVDDGLLLGI
jgi:hypothetical protein